MLRGLALVLTVLTGFSGLVYEVAWQRYLATLLGSHSEATAALLGLFLAGLSVGYVVFGALTRRLVDRARRVGRPPRLLVVYGLVEMGIGLFALSFPTFFEWVRQLSLWLPGASEIVGFGLDVGLCALLVIPPTILMGGTVPILTQALARDLDDATRLHSLVYGFNTAGAFAGALAAGFVLIPVLGLSGVMLAVSVVNLGAGLLFVVLGRRPSAVADFSSDAGSGSIPQLGSYLTIALLVGFSMMALQTTIIRLGGLSFGSSEFTFSIVVAVFVVCIALGSLGVSLLPRIPRSALAIDLWGLVVSLFALHAFADEAPYWAHVLRTQFPDTNEAFLPYHLSAFAGVFAVIGLPVVFSGASLPLLFHHLRSHAGELGDTAGKLYSANTVGSLLGALLGGYLLLFWIDLDQVYRLAVAALGVAAVLLTVRLYPTPRWTAVALLVPVGAAILLQPAWNESMLSAGLFRKRQAQALTELGPDGLAEKLASGPSLVFYEDDPSVTITVLEADIPGKGLSRAIATNGKPDSSTPQDYPTVGLAGIIPALFAERAERAFVIGYGTGVTAGEIASLSSVRQVVVAEISGGVLRAAPLFDYANMGASYDPKIRLVRRDAYRALLRSTDRFDLIVSEPSNPWVTGVEMLFSREFLEAAKDRLTPGGIYVQWLQQYETDEESLGLVLRTFDSVFEETSIWYGLGADLLLLGAKSDISGTIDADTLRARMQHPDIRAALQRCGIESFPGLLAHELLPWGVLRAAGLQGPLHTLYHPRLSHAAGRAFFRGARGRLPFTGFGRAAEIGRDNSLWRRHLRESGGSVPESEQAQLAREACKMRTPQCASILADWSRRSPGSALLEDQLAASLGAVPMRFGGRLTPETVGELSALARTPEESGRVRFRDADRALRLFKSYYLHAAPFDADAMRDLWSRCDTPADACRVGRERAAALLAKGSDPSPADAGAQGPL